MHKRKQQKQTTRKILYHFGTNLYSKSLGNPLRRIWMLELWLICASHNQSEDEKQK